MSGLLTHSPADVITSLIVALGLGTDSESNGSWPVHTSLEPDKPDNCITVYDTTMNKQGREMITGEVQGTHGCQVRIRSQDHATGYTKAKAIANAFDINVYQEYVTLTTGTTKTYLVHAITRTGDVLSLGTESPNSKRRLFTINILATIRQSN